MLFRKKRYISTGSLSKLAWQRLLKDKIAVSSMIIILFSIFIALSGYLITPDSTPLANEQHLELSTQKPGLKISMLMVEKNEKKQKTRLFKQIIRGEKKSYYSLPFSSYYFEKDEIIIKEFTNIPLEEPQEHRFNLADVLYPLSYDRVIEFSGGNLFFQTIYGEEKKESIITLQKQVINNSIKNRLFLLGTDRYGRDMLSRLMIGTRVSLSVGFISVFISLVIGIFLGSIAGFFRGRIDDLIVWFINVVWSIPTLLLVIAITFALGKGFWQIFVAVGLTMWVEVARVIRGQIMSLREKEYIEAAKALGFKNFRIIFRHILPNVMAPVIVISAANFAAAILIEAGLSFLGIGVQPPMPSWGTMIKDNYHYIILDSAYLAILPGIAIMIMVMAFMLIGNSLRDALDVKTVKD
ncbi:MAG: ABC transporter permease [Bacteroidales bacterium]|nr:ABC transporter permease [Bacteroidales bacterium]